MAFLWVAEGLSRLGRSGEEVIRGAWSGVCAGAVPLGAGLRGAGLRGAGRPARWSGSPGARATHAVLERRLHGTWSFLGCSVCFTEDFFFF